MVLRTDHGKIDEFLRPDTWSLLLVDENETRAFILSWRW